MRNTILGIIALGFFGACNSEHKEEVGRYVPITVVGQDNGILDTKTGMIYEYRCLNDNTGYYKVDSLGNELYYNHPTRVHIKQINPVKKEATSFYRNIKVNK
jgi:hypothetical protein